MYLIKNIRFFSYEVSGSTTYHSKLDCTIGSALYKIHSLWNPYWRLIHPTRFHPDERKTKHQKWVLFPKPISSRSRSIMPRKVCKTQQTPWTPWIYKKDLAKPHSCAVIYLQPNTVKSYYTEPQLREPWGTARINGASWVMGFQFGSHLSDTKGKSQ